MKPVIGLGNTAVIADVTTMAQRYGKDGSYCTANPSKPKRDLVVIAGNEPTWTTAPFAGTVADWAAYVDDVAAAVKAVDPTARVFTGGMQGGQDDYLRQALGYIEAPENISGIAFHPYATTPEEALERVRNFRRVSLSFPNKWPNGLPLFIDECGFKAADTSNAIQAAYLTSFFKLMRARRGRWRIVRVLWYGLHDRSDVATDTFDYSGGLLTPALSAKPSWSAFQGFLDWRR